MNKIYKDRLRLLRGFHTEKIKSRLLNKDTLGNYPNCSEYIDKEINTLNDWIQEIECRKPDKNIEEHLLTESTKYLVGRIMAYMEMNHKISLENCILKEKLTSLEFEANKKLNGGQLWD